MIIIQMDVPLINGLLVFTFALTIFVANCFVLLVMLAFDYIR